MDNKIMDFLNTENARIDNGNKWLVVNGTNITVYKYDINKRKSTISYEGFNLDEALRILSNKEE